jgi:hypothetical protein
MLTAERKVQIIAEKLRSGKSERPQKEKSSQALRRFDTKVSKALALWASTGHV